MSYVQRFGSKRLIGFVIGFLLTSLTIVAGLQADHRGKHRIIEVSYPDLSHLRNPACASEECAQESAALAQALANLESARDAAEEALNAYEECMDANPPNPEPGPGTPHTVELGSVLESVK
jgi:hypothetical protein